MAWAGAVGSGVADAARLIDAEIDKATAAVPETPYLLGLAGEVLLAGRETVSLISTAPSPRWRSPMSASICRKSIGCVASACWQSITPTRTTHNGLSRQHETLPDAEALSFSSAGPKRPF